MAWAPFPNDPTAIRAAIVEAQQQGPTSVARLAALCLLVCREEILADDIWTQVQAICGVGYALQHLAGNVELAEFEEFVAAWPADEVPE